MCPIEAWIIAGEKCLGHSSWLCSRQRGLFITPTTSWQLEQEAGSQWQTVNSGCFGLSLMTAPAESWLNNCAFSFKGIQVREKERPLWPLAYLPPIDCSPVVSWKEANWQGKEANGAAAGKSEMKRKTNSCLLDYNNHMKALCMLTGSLKLKEDHAGTDWSAPVWSEVAHWRIAFF